MLIACSMMFKLRVSTVRTCILMLVDCGATVKRFLFVHTSMSKLIHAIALRSSVSCLNLLCSVSREKGSSVQKKLCAKNFRVEFYFW